MIVVEGTDGTGKTTLAKALQKQLECAYVHWGRPPAWWRKTNYVTRSMDFAVYDRYHWSGYAYKAVNHQPCDLTVEDCIDLDGALRMRAGGDYATILLYSSSDEFIRERIADLKTRREEMFTADQIVEVNARFEMQREQFTLAYDVSRTFVLWETVIADLAKLRETKPVHSQEIIRPTGI